MLCPVQRAARDTPSIKGMRFALLHLATAMNVVRRMLQHAADVCDAAR